jgi:hypothetical protein
MFDILMSVKVMANEAKSVILALDPLVHNLFIVVGAVITFLLGGYGDSVTAICDVH